jgi:geranylgeranyl reductase family protein
MIRPERYAGAAIGHHRCLDLQLIGRAERVDDSSIAERRRSARAARPEPVGPPERSEADVVVVGAGPGGSAAATFLARAGHDVLLVEKSSFPRDKVCGDALTPRAVKALELLGLHDEAAGTPPGWARQEGLRMYGGGVVLDLPWPELDDFPAHSVTATRAIFDHTLAQHAVANGARLWEQTEALAAVRAHGDGGRVTGIRYQRADGRHGEVHAPIVVAADGNSSRIAVAAGLHRDRSRPMGVAIRGYYRSPRASMDVMEGYLEMRVPSGDGPGELLPGYGWIFPLADGLVNVGWGLLDSSTHFRSTNYREVLTSWVAGLPAEWELRPDTMVGRPGSAGLPMAHNRRPMVHDGLVLLGDAAGMVNPFNGEGISYAIEAAAFASEAIDHAVRTGSLDRLEAYPAAVAEAWGGYYTLGRAFVSLMGHPTVMRVCTVYGMPRMRLMRFVFRTMAHLVNHRSGDATDAVLNLLSRAVPAA